MTTAERTVDLSHLNGLLWRYRPCLERFEFLLELQLMVTASGRQDWQRHMADLFDETADRLNSIDLEREVLLGGLTLRELADDVPEPWDAILAEQQVELEAITSRIGALRQRNATAIEESAAGVTKLIEALLAEGGAKRRATTGTTYGQDGRTKQSSVKNTNSAVLFDGLA
jgi:hypothetical protein